MAITKAAVAKVAIGAAATEVNSSSNKTTKDVVEVFNKSSGSSAFRIAGQERTKWTKEDSPAIKVANNSSNSNRTEVREDSAFSTERISQPAFLLEVEKDRTHTDSVWILAEMKTDNKMVEIVRVANSNSSKIDKDRIATLIKTQV